MTMCNVHTKESVFYLFVCTIISLEFYNIWILNKTYPYFVAIGQRKFNTRTQLVGATAIYAI